MKGYSILTKLQDDVFKNNNIIIAINENSVAELYLNEQKIGIFKLVSKRLDIQFINPEIKLSITDCNLDINIKFIKTIIKDLKRKT